MADSRAALRLRRFGMRSKTIQIRSPPDATLAADLYEHVTNPESFLMVFGLFVYRVDVSAAARCLLRHRVAGGLVARCAAVCCGRHFHHGKPLARTQLAVTLQAVAQNAPPLYQPKAVQRVQRLSARYAVAHSDSALPHSPSVLYGQYQRIGCVWNPLCC